MKTTNERLLSLDALRGFDMFWIIGWGKIWHELSKLTDWSVINWWSTQMTHCDWDGFHFYDLIFPLFLFIAGISFPFSLDNSLKKGISKKGLYLRIIKRAVILIFLGFVYNGLLKLDFDTQRYAGVLVRIGLAWMFAAIIFINTRRNARILWCAGILIVYWLLLAFVQAPDYPDAPRFSAEGSIACYIDRAFLPGKMMSELYDVSGLSGIIPAVATTLLGMLTGMFIRSSENGFTKLKKAGYMSVAGVGLIALGLLWGLIFPINKPIWTSSYVCVAGGISLLLFALFYWLIDVCEYRRWTLFFTVIGMNSITIYMAQSIINFQFTANFLFGGLVKLFPKTYTPFLNSLTYIVICWLFLYFLYRKKIFLKV